MISLKDVPIFPFSRLAGLSVPKPRRSGVVAEVVAVGFLSTDGEGETRGPDAMSKGAFAELSFEPTCFCLRHIEDLFGHLVHLGCRLCGPHAPST